MPVVDASQIYFNKNFVHAKNKLVYMPIDHMSILDRL
jgi:hypothetical protein